MDQLKLRYTWPDGVQADPVGELHLHREDDSFGQYGFVRWELYDPTGTTSEFNMGWQMPDSGVITVNVDAIPPFDRFVLESIVATFMACVNFIAPKRLLAALRFLGVGFDFLPPPETLDVPPPSQLDFDEALAAGRVTPGPGNNNVAEYQWRVGRVVNNRLDVFASHKYGEAGFVGMVTSKKAVEGRRKLIYWFQSLGGQ